MNSLRSRLILSSAIILLGFGFLTVLALDKAFYASALEAQEDKMKGTIYLLLGAIDLNEKGVLTLNENQVQDPRLLTKGSGLTAMIMDDMNHIIWKSPSFREGITNEFPKVETGQWQWRSFQNERKNSFFQLGFGVSWMVEKEKAENFSIYLEEDPAMFLQQMERYHRMLWKWLSIVGFFLLVTLTAVLQWGLRPIQQVANHLKDIQSGKEENLRGEYPSELLPMTRGLNELLRHERHQQRRFRNALDDLAHSLKTPLAAIRGMSNPQISEQVERIDKIVDYQVRRASSVGRSAFTQPIQLRPAVNKMINALSKVYRDKNIQFTILVEEHFQVVMDEGDLMEVLGNLLENASKWCSKQVVLKASRTSTYVLIEVEDDGPGFPKEGKEVLLQRGVRADLRVPGEGIGLSVVQEIIKLYDGKIDLNQSSLRGGGVRLTLPTQVL